ncbi:proline--tRNA ligase [Gammaproteobacteria bacterium]|nr:proline--tRNA ligase [Gammaproteobacteria bacterium]
MRAKQFSINTLKETPSEAEIVSHRLMIRAGLIKKTASGIYSWMPLGLRVLRKIEAIIREEMNSSGALEVLLPAIQPAELWKESGRWNQYDEGLLLKLKDRQERDFCFGPTHEEVVTDLARSELRSHRQLPINFYQIQTKFRDETRPRFGVLRAREFIMKDAYSFHINKESLEETYRTMHSTYSTILKRMELDFRPVEADSGSIGGSASTEFHVLADSGEDLIAFSTESDYAANVELAEAVSPKIEMDEVMELEKVATPGKRSIEQVSEFLQVPIEKTIKTLIVKGITSKLVGLVLRGDHRLSSVKAEKISEVATPITLADESEIRDQLGCGLGYIGPAGTKIPMYVDRSAASIKNFIAGANEDDYHLKNLNWERDAKISGVMDLREVKEGDPSPDGKGTIQLKRGIEVGHIFQLGDKYSKSLKATVLNQKGENIRMEMGCYGMGVTRLAGAIIEQNNDQSGIIWPKNVAPFELVIIPINAGKSKDVRDRAEDLYKNFLERGCDVIIDDREDVRPGAKFNEWELIGVPHRIVISEKGLAKNLIEYRARDLMNTLELSAEEAFRIIL